MNLPIWNKYNISKLDTATADSEVYIKQVYGTPITNVETFINDNVKQVSMFNNHTYKQEIYTLIVKIFRERYYCSILGLSPEAAWINFNSILMDSSSKFGPIIKELTSQAIEAAIRYEYQDQTEEEKHEIVTSKDDSATDQDSRSAIELTEELEQTSDYLRKFNDTPQAGNNPDLTTDTYLSASERNTEVKGPREISNDIEDIVTKTIGERLNTLTTLKDPNENYITARRHLSVPHIASILTSLYDTYEQWMIHVERRIMTL